MLKQLEAFCQGPFRCAWARLASERSERIVGTCGFADSPVNGEAEIAYVTFSGNEGRGIARQVAVALMREARRTADTEAFVAHTQPQERPSTSPMQRLGFECLGAIEHPDDGAIWKGRQAR